MSDVIFLMKKQDVHSIGGGAATPRSRPVKKDVNRGGDFNSWSAMKTVYFPTWVWREICRRYPEKYQMNLPTYQGQKVILT